VALAFNLGLNVLVAGMEPKKQREFLAAHLCDFLLFGKPLLLAEATAFLMNS